MISSRSRYKGTATARVAVSPTDIRVTIVPSSAAAWQFNYTYYMVKQGDRIDTIARFFYGDDTKWWLIADANPEILDWMTLTPATVLRIPSA